MSTIMESEVTTVEDHELEGFLRIEVAYVITIEVTKDNQLCEEKA